MKATHPSRQGAAEAPRVFPDAATELAGRKSQLAVMEEELRWARLENRLLDLLAIVQDRAFIVLIADLSTYEQAMLGCFKELSGSSKELSGSSKELSGSSKELSGSSNEFSGSSKEGGFRGVF